MRKPPSAPVEIEHTGRTWRRLSVPCPLLLHGQHFEQHGVPVGLLLLHTSHVQPHRLHAVHLPEVPPALPLGDVLRTAPAPAPGFRSLAGPEAGLLLEGVEQELSLLGKGLAWGQPTRWMQRTDIPLVRAGVEHEGPGPGLVWTRRSMPSEGLTCIHLDVATGCLEAIWVSKHAGLGHLDRLGGYRDLRTLHAKGMMFCYE